ncbi:FAD/NAD(P)-binding domain-containing protein [Mycena pura]|uniref:FAD/NAD(P)-binding domain-containing protein n=1 Tax=Mycena pura TaxID=153505 RepID=A0AAD6UT50_9AGAR|nr:FAD/NAD(P)-binding domain-containing protein [Mycena pura]
MKVAVVGSGVAGLAATWLLNEHSDHEVDLYESDSRPGGHANTVYFTPPGRKPEEGVYVDTGFIVFNPSTYPNFIKFLKMQGIKIKPTEMTFSVSRDSGLFEWAGSNLMTIFCQPYRLLDPNMWRLIYDVLRFNACARSIITSDSDAEISIGEYLDREGYSESFRDNYLIPMTACIWSTPPDKCAMDFPARTLIQFMNNHHLLQITGKPSWLTLDGGSRVYVNRILSKLPAAKLHLSTPVASVSTQEGTSTVQLTTSDGVSHAYDHVIFACHSDTVLDILQAGKGMTADEQNVLGMFQWNRNEAVLHSDTNLMPKSRLAWACWNFLTTSVFDAQGRRKANSDQLSLYVHLITLINGMNDLQHISETKYGPVLVTLNPPFEPREGIAGRWSYDHPVLDANAVRAQKLMRTIQRTRGLSYAGAYLKYGFHEDGFASGLDAARHLLPPGSQLPFAIDLDVDRRPPSARVAGAFFAVFETTGLRGAVGVVGAWVCAVVGWCVWRRARGRSFCRIHHTAAILGIPTFAYLLSGAILIRVPDGVKVTERSSDGPMADRAIT